MAVLFGAGTATAARPQTKPPPSSMPGGHTCAPVPGVLMAQKLSPAHANAACGLFEAVARSFAHGRASLRIKTCGVGAKG